MDIHQLERLMRQTGTVGNAADLLPLATEVEASVRNELCIKLANAFEGLATRFTRYDPAVGALLWQAVADLRK
jgi:hypothetical protein